MAIDKKYFPDYEEILSHRYDYGADYWTTPDKRLIKGSPFSTLECIQYLLELGIEPTVPLLKNCANLLFSTWIEDGRFRVYPHSSIYPCHTTLVAESLCCLGYSGDK